MHILRRVADGATGVFMIVTKVRRPGAGRYNGGRAGMSRIAVGLLLLLTAAVSYAQSGFQPLAVVRLNRSETITVNQVKARATLAERQYGVTNLPLEQKKALLNNLISEKLIVQAAAKEGIAITDTQVDEAFLNTFSQQLGTRVSEAQLNQIMKDNYGQSLDDYILEQSGMSKADYKTYLKNQILIQRYVVEKRQNELQRVAATDEEIRNAYEMNKAQLVWNDMIKIFLVLYPKGDDPVAARAMATDLRNRYENDNAEADAIKNSPENGQTYQAGDLIVAKTAQNAQQLGWSVERLNELFSHDEGYLSEISETDTNFQFYAVQKKYAAKMLAISDIVEPDSTVTVYEYIRQNLTQQKQSQFLAQAAQEIADSLNTPENVEWKRTGDDLDNLLNNW